MSSLFLFHLKQYSKNTYFLSNVILSTGTLVLLQFIASYVYDSDLISIVWIRSAIFGLWASGTTAAGIVGMQKWQGTLIYLLNNPTSDYISLVALVSSAASFGLLSFPIAYFICLLLGYTQMYVTVELIIYILCLWLGAVALDFCIASLFVWLKDAIIYEELIALPLLLFSGLFAVPEQLKVAVDVLGWVLPISTPIQWLLKNQEFSYEEFFKYICSLCGILVFSYFVTKKIISLSKETGQFGGL